MKYYVYRFIDNDSNVIYVGRSTDLKKRMYGYTNAKRENYIKANKEKTRIEYIVEQTPKDAHIKELYYINLYKPKYNQQDKQSEKLKLRLESDTWLTYEAPEHREIQSLKWQIEHINGHVKMYQKWYEEHKNHECGRKIYECEKRISELVKENIKLKEENKIVNDEHTSFIEIKSLLNRVLDKTMNNL